MRLALCGNCSKARLEEKSRFPASTARDLYWRKNKRSIKEEAMKVHSSSRKMQLTGDTFSKRKQLVCNIHSALCLHRSFLFPPPSSSIFPASTFFCANYRKLVYLFLLTYYFAIDLTAFESVYTRPCVYIFMIMLIWTQTLTFPELSQ